MQTWDMNMNTNMNTNIYNNMTIPRLLTLQPFTRRPIWFNQHTTDD